MLSDYQMQIIKNQSNNFSDGREKKLIPNLDMKTKYKLYLNLGLQLKTNS